MGSELCERYGVYDSDDTFLGAYDLLSEAKQGCPKGGYVCDANKKEKVVYHKR